MNSNDWLIYFQQNQRDRHLIAWHEGVQVRSDLRQALARSLATFQLGESTEGKRLLAGACRVAERNSDPDYAAAMKLFIAEEHEHARLLANVLSLMNAPLAKHHWAEGLFHLVRNLWGYHFEVAVLLMAEIIALQYFNTVRRGAGDGTVAAVCDQILYDEKFHIRFHCEYLHRAIAAKPVVIRGACWSGLAVLYAGASAVVAWDSRQVFVALGSSSREFLGHTWQDFAAARHAIFTGEAFDWSAATGQAETETRWSPLARIGSLALCRLQPPQSSSSFKG